MSEKVESFTLSVLILFCTMFEKYHMVPLTVCLIEAVVLLGENVSILYIKDILVHTILHVVRGMDQSLLQMQVQELNSWDGLYYIPPA